MNPEIHCLAALRVQSSPGVRLRQVGRLFGALTAVAVLAAAPPLAVAAPLTQCKRGQHVVYGADNASVIAGEHDGECLIRSADGRLQSWIALGELTPVGPRRPAPPAQPSAPPTEAEAGEGEEAAAVPEAAETVEFYGWPVVLAAPRREARREHHGEGPRSVAGKPAATKRGVQPTRTTAHPNLSSRGAPSLHAPSIGGLAPPGPH